MAQTQGFVFLVEFKELQCPFFNKSLSMEKYVSTSSFHSLNF